jgi:hypothetical protein
MCTLHTLPIAHSASYRERPMADTRQDYVSAAPFFENSSPRSESQRGKGKLLTLACEVRPRPCRPFVQFSDAKEQVSRVQRRRGGHFLNLGQAYAKCGRRVHGGSLLQHRLSDSCPPSATRRPRPETFFPGNGWGLLNSSISLAGLQKGFPSTCFLA